MGRDTKTKDQTSAARWLCSPVVGSRWTLPHSTQKSDAHLGDRTGDAVRLDQHGLAVPQLDEKHVRLLLLGSFAVAAAAAAHEARHRTLPIRRVDLDPHRGRQAAQDRGRVKVGPGGASTCDQTVIGMSVDEKWQLARKVSCVGDGVTRRQAVPCLSRKLLPGRCWTPQGERIVSTRVRLFREPSNRRRTDAAAIQPVTRTQQAVCRCRAGLQPCQSIVSTLNIVIILRGME